MTAQKKIPRARERECALVTSAAGGMGRIVCRRLHRTYDVVAVDGVAFPDRPKDVDHHQLDLRRKAATQLLKKRRPDVVVHISGVHASPSNNRRAGQKLVEATVQLLKLVEQTQPRKLVLLSSAMLYGPSATSASYLSEEAPLLGAGIVPELADAISLDMMVQSFFWKRPDTETVILRPIHVVGPHLDNLASRYLKLGRAPTMLGFDPMIQVVHEDDVVLALERALVPGVRGVFNVVGQSQAPLSRLLHARGASSLPVPGPLLHAALARAASWRLSPIDAGELAFLRYSFLVDGDRATRELGFRPARSLTQTLADLV
ncbi:MAG TPA: NAD-dependent epimerase/dehydratase family protein [Myxococcota bacterium]